ncbi:MAG TPA: Nif3-like dinuclear metal center hexameric protein [Cytophagales bacterium]|nr:Nif3-like dinuclear metal center hexameric protein [Cytophagales bacterium]
MKASIKEITNHLESIAPLAYQESYDNSGLLYDSGEKEVKGILISLDCTEQVVEEAIQRNCNLIISHHPIIFKGLKKIIGKNYVERTILKAIKNGISLYAIHTNLDNVANGVSFKIAEKLKLENVKVLETKSQLIQKLVTFVPEVHREKVMNALFEAGAGKIGNYSDCSYISEGTGTFKPNQKADPFIGESGKMEFVRENRIEVIYPAHLSSTIIQSLLSSHPYETPAYDIYTLQNEHIEVGSGAIGTLAEKMSEPDFFNYLKQSMNLKCIRHTPFLGREISKVAVCGGAGSFLLNKAIREKADVFITADFKYHEFFDSETKIIIADVGHYESEVFTKDLIFDILNKKFSNIATLLSNTNTNPVQYFY